MSYREAAEDAFLSCIPWVLVFSPLAVLALAVVVIIRTEEPAQASTTVAVTEYLRTVEHDGHRFVSSRSTGGLLHHPDCPCGKAEEVK
jgi:hypothetical protein